MKFGMDIGDKVFYLEYDIKPICGKLPEIGEFCGILEPEV